MTPEVLVKSCMENRGYETPELNEVLILHYKGAAAERFRPCQKPGTVKCQLRLPQNRRLGGLLECAIALPRMQRHQKA